MKTWIISGIVVVVVLFIIIAINSNKTSSKKEKWSNVPERREHISSHPRPQPQATRSAEHREQAAKAAAKNMESHQMKNNGTDAVRIQHALNQQRLTINTSFLSTAQAKINNICSHAENIRLQIQQHYNDSSYLIRLYRIGVGVSNEAFALRNEVKDMKDSLYQMSKVNPSLKPLFDEVNTFYKSVYENEVELNSRNRTLRMYIGNNFGVNERQWNDDIERRAREKRTA